jgi:NAD(P)-dependent dehydrogenase (short-subunit alcohol dehydrogenase family)
MTIMDTTVLVTGANRGIGRALVEEALRRGAARVYAAARQPVAHPDQRVTPLALDVTDAEQIDKAAAGIDSLDLLINNAGIQPFDDLTDPAALERTLAVNLFGTYRVSQAFLPSLTRSRGMIVTNASLAALAPVPFAPAYSISKAAAFSLTQSLRLLLARQGVTVHSVLTGPTDTEMTRDLDIPKASPESVARAIFDGIENGEEDIFPDPLSQAMAEGWRGGVAKQFERQNATLVPAEPRRFVTPAGPLPAVAGSGRTALAAAGEFGHERHDDDDDHRDQPDDEKRLEHGEDPANGYEGKPDSEDHAEDCPYHPAHAPSMRPTPCAVLSSGRRAT